MLITPFPKTLLDIMVYNMEKTKRPSWSQAQSVLENLYIKVNTRSWYRMFNNILDGDVWIVSLDENYSLDVTPFGNSINVH